LGLGVADREPIVRPWKEFWKDTNSNLEPVGSRTFPDLRANFMAASLASLPELQMNTERALRMPPASRVFLTSNSDSAPVQGL